MKVQRSQVVFAGVLSVVIPLATAAQAKQSPSAANARMTVRACKASDLSLGTDGENGSFNGMSHSGTLLVLRNLSPSACSVPARPEITFFDGGKPAAKPLPVNLEIPGAKFMHPGPVLLPVVIAPEAEVTSKLRWVSGEVYDSSLCFDPASISVSIQGQQQRTALGAHICGDRSKGVTFEATPLVPDPQFQR